MSNAQNTAKQGNIVILKDARDRGTAVMPPRGSGKMLTLDRPKNKYSGNNPNISSAESK
jgi:hypothetical protein